MPKGNPNIGKLAIAAGTTFKKGQSGNPGGKPLHAKNSLTNDFWRFLAADFAKFGNKAIIEMRVNDPAAYIRTVASLMPKDIAIQNPDGTPLFTGVEITFVKAGDKITSET